MDGVDKTHWWARRAVSVATSLLAGSALSRRSASCPTRTLSLSPIFKNPSLKPRNPPSSVHLSSDYMGFRSVRLLQISLRSTIQNPFSLTPLHAFCSNAPTTETPASEPSITPDSAPSSLQSENPNPARPLRGANRRPPEKPEDLVCRMIASRPWTTRLQNSIRNVVPVFDSSLVYNVLHGLRTADQALDFFRWVEKTGFHHDRATHAKIVERLGRVSKLNHARCIIFDMPKRGLDWDEDLFVVLINSYGKAGIVQESVKIFDKMKELGVDRTIKSYNTLFKAILRRGRYMMAKRYFNKMLAEGVWPTRHTYNIMIWGFFLSLKKETALRFFEDMKSRGVVPDEVTYNTLINGCCRFKKMDEAEKFLDEMKGRDLVPNVITYTTMIKGYISVGRIDDSLQLIGEMGSNGIKPNATTYSTVLPGLCDAEKMVDARKLLKEMAERYIAPKDNSIFLRLMSCMCKTMDFDGAAEVLKAMIRLSIPTESSHYGVLIEGFCKEGMHDKAVKMVDKVLEKGILSGPSEMESTAYNPMIEYLCSHGGTKKAETFFRQLMKKGAQDEIAFNNLIRGHSKEGTPESGLELLKIMERRGVASDIDSYGLLVESFLRKGEPADAKMALDGMIQSGHLPSPSLFRSVMEGLFDDERVQTASRVMNSMIEKGVKENMDMVYKILEALLLRGHVEEALSRIDLLINNCCVPDFDRLLTVLCEKNKTAAALKLLDYGLERDCNISFSSQDWVLDTLLSAGRTLNAYSILCKIMEKGGVTDRSSCEDLIRSLNAEGNTKQADILSRMVMGNKPLGGKRGKKIGGV
ncbi:large ribosomal subunit protein mL102 (rPPR5) [Magnolia sinica]|uniref:large ribosomal subunit protein mL102 (rPPR5) n=1 Tax=Magnolia sinica TaxID=86752 RepID=UPI002658A378|nr:large ribosomal subunit protein mL102 (rPPR5) [Magnolia sinica]